MTLWFHPLCAAYKRPEPFLTALEAMPADLADREYLKEIAQRCVTYRRLPRIDGAERAPSAKARCRHCRESIDKADWRVRLVFYEEGMFTPGGFIHLRCGRVYFETDVVLDQAIHFSPGLSFDEREELRRGWDSDLAASC